MTEPLAGEGASSREQAPRITRAAVHRLPAIAFGLGALLTVLFCLPAFAQVPPLAQLLQETGGGSASGRIIQLIALLTVLSVRRGCSS